MLNSAYRKATHIQYSDGFIIHNSSFIIHHFLLIMLWLRLIIFTILVPGTVAGYIPYRLLNELGPDWNKPTLKWVGLIVLIIGIVIYLICAISFLLRGLGTLMIWFAKPLKFLVGEELK